MHRRRRDDWVLRTYGNQREQLEVDLLAQIVIMLGRQVAQENGSDEVIHSETDSED